MQPKQRPIHEMLPRWRRVVRQVAMNERWIAQSIRQAVNEDLEYRAYCDQLRKVGPQNAIEAVMLDLGIRSEDTTEYIDEDGNDRIAEARGHEAAARDFDQLADFLDSLPEDLAEVPRAALRIS